MKLLTKSTLSAAVIAAMATTSAQANQFVDDSSMNIHLRNYYKNQNVKDGTAKADKDTGWAQAIRADFSSGYYADIIGFDLSTHYSLKLHESLGDDDSSDTGLFRPGSLKNGKRKGESYGKTFGAVKVNLMNNGVAKYGRMRLDTPLLNESDSRALPSTTEALYADYSMSGVTVFGAYATKGNARNASGFEEFGVADADGKIRKRAVKTFGGSYEMGGLNISAAYGQQNDSNTSLYTDASYSLPLSDGMTVKVGGQYGKHKLIGDTKDASTLNNAQAKNTIDWFGLMAGLTVKQLTASLSMTDVGGSKDNQSALLDNAGSAWSNGDDATTFNGYNSVQISDFYEANERSFMVKVGYNLNDMIEGLSASALYVSGEIDEAAGTKDTDTSEYNLRVDYKLPAVEGLKLTLRHAKYEVDAEGKSGDETYKDTRVIITYDLAVF